tara:strand:+ start:2396 stop:2515 length:120 start_codon:yes stop_codon:yes gene_type:complete
VKIKNIAQGEAKEKIKSTKKVVNDFINDFVYFSKMLYSL